MRKEKMKFSPRRFEKVSLSLSLSLSVCISKHEKKRNNTNIKGNVRYGKVTHVEKEALSAQEPRE